MTKEWKNGDKFWLIKPSKNFPELNGKELTVGIVWGEGEAIEVTPVEAFCAIPVSAITKLKPEPIKFEVISTKDLLAFADGLIKGLLLIWLIKQLF